MLAVLAVLVLPTMVLVLDYKCSSMTGTDWWLFLVPTLLWTEISTGYSHATSY